MLIEDFKKNLRIRTIPLLMGIELRDLKKPNIKDNKRDSPNLRLLENKDTFMRILSELLSKTSSLKV